METEYFVRWKDVCDILTNAERDAQKLADGCDSQAMSAHRNGKKDEFESLSRRAAEHLQAAEQVRKMREAFTRANKVTNRELTAAT